MKIIYDNEVDALRIIFRKVQVTTKHLNEDISIDYDESGKVAGIEILDASEKLDLNSVETYFPVTTKGLMKV